MGRSDLERLSKEELIELVLRLQRPPKTSRTSSKPPATDRKERREQAKPGGAKPGHEGHSRAMSPDVDRLADHQPDHCLRWLGLSEQRFWLFKCKRAADAVQGR
jgi:transposase